MLQKQDRMQRIKKGIGTGDRWDMVRLQNGIIGYISQNYVTEVPPVQIENIEISILDQNEELEYIKQNFTINSFLCYNLFIRARLVK